MRNNLFLKKISNRIKKKNIVSLLLFVFCFLLEVFVSFVTLHLIGSVTLFFCISMFDIALFFLFFFLFYSRVSLKLNNSFKKIISFNEEYYLSSNNNSNNREKNVLINYEILEKKINDWNKKKQNPPTALS